MTKKFSKPQLESLNKLQDIFGYTFDNKKLALDSISIPVSKHDKASNFKRLEYLGDRIYNMCAAAFMTIDSRENMPSQLNPGLLNRVSNARQVDIARHLGLQHILLMQRHRLPSSMATGRSKLLADVLEAIVAAIFIDSDCDFKTIYDIYVTQMESAPVRAQHINGDAHLQLQFNF